MAFNAPHIRPASLLCPPHPAAQPHQPVSSVLPRAACWPCHQRVSLPSSCFPFPAWCACTFQMSLPLGAFPWYSPHWSSAYRPSSFSHQAVLRSWSLVPLWAQKAAEGRNWLDSLQGPTQFLVHGSGLVNVDWIKHCLKNKHVCQGRLHESIMGTISFLVVLERLRDPPCAGFLLPKTWAGDWPPVHESCGFMHKRYFSRKPCSLHPTREEAGAIQSLWLSSFIPKKSLLKTVVLKLWPMSESAGKLWYNTEAQVWYFKEPGSLQPPAALQVTLLYPKVWEPASRGRGPRPSLCRSSVPSSLAVAASPVSHMLFPPVDSVCMGVGSSRSSPTRFQAEMHSGSSSSLCGSTYLVPTMYMWNEYI